MGLDQIGLVVAIAVAIDVLFRVDAVRVRKLDLDRLLGLRRLLDLQDCLGVRIPLTRLASLGRGVVLPSSPIVFPHRFCSIDRNDRRKISNPLR